MTAISVAMATRNGERFLREQLETIAAQTRQPAELVVCDDASTDRTTAILERFASASSFLVRVQVNERRLGAGDNFLQAAALCKGDVIAFCDQDDLWRPEKLERCTDELSAASALLVVHANEVVLDDGTPTGERFPRIDSTYAAPPLSSDPWQGLPGMSMVFDAGLTGMAAPQLRPRSHVDPAQQILHDEWIYLLARSLGTVVFLSERLGSYRQHGQNVLGAPAPDEGGWRQARRFGESYYRKRRDQAADAARLFDSLAVVTDDPDERAKLARAESWYRALAELIERRLAVYDSEASTARRLAAVGRLLRARDYRRRQDGGLGGRSLLKDVAVALTPAKR